MAIETGKDLGSLDLDSSFFHSIIDDLPVAIFAKDVSNGYQLVLWNKKQEEVTTIRREKALFKDDYDLFAQESADYFREMDEAIVRGGKLLDIPEEIIEKRDGGEVYLHTTKVPIDVKGRIILVGISEDITERIRGREQLEHLNSDLYRKNEELESTQLQLIQAAKLESIGRLAAGVAHEVKNPLNLLVQGVDYLESSIGKSDENIDFILTEMKDAIRRAEEIVKGLVDFSSNRQMKKEPIGPISVIEHVLLMVRHEFNKNQVVIKRHFDSDLNEIFVDAVKFEQVLVNVFMNAVHAMADEQSPELEISVYNESIKVERDEGKRSSDHLRSGDQVVVIELKDNGSGISPDHLEQIFDPFFTTKATGTGTGLGLSVVRKIIQLHKGDISIKNRSDKKGATTRITMPCNI